MTPNLNRSTIEVAPTQSTSLDVVQDLIKQLEQIMPQAFSEGKLDVNQLKTLIGENNMAEGERYALTWAGKSEAYKVLQATTTTTLNPEFDKSINWVEAENVLIEGENLDVLKVLQKSYYGKVKMIYIDPPYNTGSDSFIYPDNFSETRDEYLKRIGDKDDEGLMMREGFFRKNNRENGRFHSNWLNMMLPRLFLARNLLKDDGVIFVSIDDNEQANLKLLMDEVFGEENFINTLIVIRSQNGLGDKKGFATNQDYIHVYQKSELAKFNGHRMSEEDVREYKREDIYGKFKIDGLFRKKGAASSREDRPNMYYPVYYNPKDNSVNDEPKDGYIPVYPTKEDGSAGRWLWGPEKFKSEKDKIFAGKNGTIYLKNYIPTGGRRKTKSLLDSPDVLNDQSTNELKYIFGSKIFDTPKPVELIKIIVDNVCRENDIVLDFFAGSGTTAQAVLELNEQDGGNRKFICVQLPEHTEEGSEAQKAGYDSIIDITQERIKRVIQRIEKIRNSSLELNKHQPLGFRKYKLEGSNFKIWRGDTINSEQELKQQMELFVCPQRANAKTENMLWELLIKYGRLLTEKIQTAVLPDGAVIYYTEEKTKRLAFVLDTFTTVVQEEILQLKPKSVLILDSLFTERDNEKTNAQLKFEDNAINFKTV